MAVLVYRGCIGKPSKLSCSGFVAIAVAWFVAVLLILPVGMAVDVPFVILFGWIVGLWRFFSGFHLEWLALLVGLIALGLFFPTLHFFLRGICRQYAKPWTFRQTRCVGGILFAVCLGGIAILVGIHEVYWAVTSDENWFTSGEAIAARRMQSSNNIKQIGLAAHNFNDGNKTLPMGGTMLNAETPGHSWATQMLPYIEQVKLYEKIDQSVPWSASENRESFETDVSMLRSPMMSERHNDKGYALTHYAVNERLLPVGKSVTLGNISDGTSNTILSGEVNGNLRAWGDPINGRDPALGINKTPYGFGSRFPGGANMGLCDGSVTFVSDTADLKLLEALATPNGGESVTIP